MYGACSEIDRATVEHLRHERKRALTSLAAAALSPALDTRFTINVCRMST